MMKQLLCIIYIFLALPMLKAQNWQIQHYTTKDGLPHNFGYDVIEDQKGFIWIGTDDGIARFDGQTFKSYGSKQKDPLIMVAISESPDGQIFGANYRKGVYKILHDSLIKTGYGLSPQGYRNFLHPHLYWFQDELFVVDQREGINGAVIGHYQADMERSVALVVEDEQLKLKVLTSKEMQKKFMTRQYARQHPDQPIHIDIHLTTDGDMYWATNVGLFEYQGNGEFQRIKKGNFKHIIGHEGLGVFLTEEGKIWHWKEGVFRMLTEAMQKQIMSIAVNRAGILIWFEKGSKTLQYINTQNGKKGDFANFLQLKSLPSQIGIDSQGSFWVTTHGEGVYHLSFSPIQHISLSPDPQYHNIRALTEDHEGNIWIGTSNGLLVYNPKERKEKSQDYPFIRSFSEVPIFQVVFGIGPDPLIKNKLLVSAFSGNYVVNLTNNDVQKVHPVGNTYLDWSPTGRLTLREQNELIVYSPFEKLASFPFINKKIGDSSFDPGSSGTIAKNAKDIWLTAPLGLIHFFQDSKIQYAYDQFFDGEVIVAMEYDLDSTLWLATSKGVFHFNGKNFIPHPQNDALEVVCKMLVFDRQGKLWGGSSEGIFRLDSTQITKASTLNGLIEDDITSLYFDKQNRLWIGTISGLALLEDPYRIQPTNPPRLILSSITVNGKPWDIKQQEVPMKAEIALEVNTIDLKVNAKPVLQYRLREDAKWISTNDRRFEFSNLSPGDYQFQFRSRNANSVWCEPLQVQLHLPLLWWQRWDFIMLVSLLSLGLVSMIARLRIQNIRKRAHAQNELNQQMAHLQLSALQSQLNPHFMFNALNAIQYFIINQDEVTANDYLAKFSRLMRLFLEASHSRYIALTEEIELLELYIELEKLRFEGKFDFEIKVSPQIDPDDIEIPSMMLQPFVENAINHGLRHKQAAGHLLISFEQSHDRILCSIQDDGIGREAARHIRTKQDRSHVSRGMKLLEKRLMVLRKIEKSQIDIKYIDLKNDEGQVAGTKVEISLSI